MRNVTIILAVLAVVALGAPAYGSWIGGQGVSPADPNDWHTDANWTEGSVPNTVGATAMIYNDGTAVVSASVGAIGQIKIGNGGAGAGTIQMVTGGVFGVNNNHPWLTLGYFVTTGTSTFIMSGGTFGGTRTNVGQVGTSGYVGAGLFEVSGGSVDVTAGSMTVNKTGTFRVIGSDATKVDLAGKSGADIKFDVKIGGTLNMQLDDSGITNIKVHNTYSVTNPNYDLDGIATFESGSILDMGWETGATPTVGTYLLLVADIIVDNGLALKAGQDVADGGDWDIVWGTGSDTLSVTYVPEPATMVLLGLGGIGVLIRRKRR